MHNIFTHIAVIANFSFSREIFYANCIYKVDFWQAPFHTDWSAMTSLPQLHEQYFQRFVFTSFWFLGFCNGIPFLIMLSAAYDFLKPIHTTMSHNDESADTALAHSNLTRSAQAGDKGAYDCNSFSTGVVLLADVLPSICIKLVAPFFVHHITY